MSVEKKHVEEVEEKRKHERQFSVHDKEIFLAKAFRCSFKIMDRLQKNGIKQYKNEKKKMKQRG